MVKNLMFFLPYFYCLLEGYFFGKILCNTMFIYGFKGFCFLKHGSVDKPVDNFFWRGFLGGKNELSTDPCFLATFLTKLLEMVYFSMGWGWWRENFWQLLQKSSTLNFCTKFIHKKNTLLCVRLIYMHKK